MIIDAHTHLLDRSWLPAPWWQWLHKFYTDGQRAFSPASKRGETAIESLWDPDGSKLIAAMDEAGVDKSIVLPLDFGIRFGEPEISITEQHRRIHGVVAAHPSRLIGFVGVDPRRPEAIDIIRSSIKDLGFMGVKLHPGAGFSVRSTAMQPIWEQILELDVPVMVHTGHAFGPLMSRHCQPIDLDDPLAKYPDLRIVAAHLAGGWFDELCWMGYTKPNLYADISLWQNRCRQNRADFISAIRTALDMFGPGRLLFGTDWPFTAGLMQPKEYVRIIRELGADGKTRFMSAEIKGLLGGNVQKLLGDRRSLKG
jgi:uncharacterized protein